MTQVARILPINSIILLFKLVFDDKAPIDVIITGCITHSPNKVITKKYTKCLPLMASCDLKVNLLFAKKLKTNAVDVEIKLLAIAGKPKPTKMNKIKKSIEVFRTPTIAKRSFSACFFSVFFIYVTFLDKI